MPTATLTRKRKTPSPTFGLDSNGILMTPEEFNNGDFEDGWCYELINGVLIVSPIPSEQEVGPNEFLGYLLLTYKEQHPQGKSLDGTLPERYVKFGSNRRRADRVIWSGLGRMPRKKDKPTIVVEFVSGRRRDRERDYETKRGEYQRIKIQEYWIIDRFTQTMTVHLLESGKFKKKVIPAGQTYRTKLLPGIEVPLGRLLELATSGPTMSQRSENNHENEDRRQWRVRPDGETGDPARA
jgi:Uma2 family endonuclease